MFGAFTSFGKLGSLARAIAAAWTPSALWPTGTEPGMWISPSTLPASFNDYLGTTPVATPGTVADSANPVGLALDIRAGATVLTDPGNHMLQSTSVARPLMSAYDGQTLGPGDTYDATGYPIYQKYDGVDDGMATATFAAGTLSNAMDCMIAVRRDSGAKTICGIYNAADVAQYTGYAESGVSDPCIHNIGTPTTWVDGVQLAGGVAVTADTLNTALTIGAWHILEYRGLDLSLFEKIGYGINYYGYLVNGALGGILLFPSSTSAADRDAARAWLAAKVGVTLP